tara:strand:- start:1873 stop:2676 length:804 start_codon:yes stop_codon:yes gene_type:complete
MNHLELFSGTHSFGKVSSKLGYNVYSLDRDLGDENDGYKSENHFKEDIMTWDYKQFNRGFFKVITASPVCMWWSNLRRTWIGRKLKSHGDTIITKEILDEDIELYGVPMVDKVFEIIDYFDPQYFIIENPKTGKMKDYINPLIPFYDVDYCKYSNWGYKKTTRFWTNIEGLVFNKCNNDCENMIEIKGKKLHNNRMGTSKTINDNGKIIRVNTAVLRAKYKDYPNLQGKKHKKDVSITVGGGSNRLERYRIPPQVIEKFFNSINHLS